MTFCEEVKLFRRTLVLIITPIILLPLLIFPPNGLELQLRCAYTILLMAVYWISEVVPLAVTALLPLCLYPFLGVVSAKDTSIQYLKDVNVLFLGGLSVAVAVEHWNLHKRIALKVLTFVGAKPRWLLFGFMATTAFLSMWISNVATTAMMIPIAQAVLQELTSDNVDSERKSSKSDSIDDNNKGSELSDMEKLSPAERNYPGSNNGNYYTSVLAQKESPTEEKVIESVIPIDEDEPCASTQELITSPKIEIVNFNEKLDRQTRNKNLGKALTICVCYSANIGGTATLTGTGPNLIMAGLFKTTYPHAPEVDFGSWTCFSFPGMVIYLLIAWFWLQYLFLDINWREIFPCFFKKSSKKSEDEQLGEKAIQRQYEALGPISFAEKAVLFWFILLALLWLTRDPGFIRGWGSLISYFTKGYVSDASVAITITFILFVFPSKRPNIFCWKGKEGNSEKGPVPALLTWNVLHQKMAWNVIIILGGSFAMALGSKESGLSAWIGTQMTPLKAINPFLANLICCLIVCALTQCTSNTATATVFLPILAELAEVLQVNPLYLMLPSTVITSYAFMLPVSTPPNAIAYSYGHLKMMDMIKAGVLLNVVGIFVALFSVHTFGNIAFQVFTACPEWLHSTYCNHTLTTNSTFS